MTRDEQQKAQRLIIALTTEPDCTCGAWNSGECSCDASWPDYYTTDAATTLGNLLAENEALRDLATDAVAGLRYIAEHHGELPGVGWQRVFDKAAAAIRARGEAGMQWEHTVITWTAPHPERGDK